MRLQTEHEEQYREEWSSAGRPMTDAEAASAVAAIEARKAQEAEAVGLKAALRETLQELNSDITDEEILEEVRKQRNETILRENERLRQLEQRSIRRTKRMKMAAFVAVPLFFIGMVNGVNRYHDREREALQQSYHASQLKGAEPTFCKVTPETLVLDKSSGSTVIRTLAEIPDGQTVQVETASLKVGGSFRSSNDLIQMQSDAGRWWTIVKHNGRVYLRVATAQPISASALRQGKVYLLNRPVAGNISLNRYRSDGRLEKWTLAADRPQEVTIPIDGIRFNPKTGGERVGAVGWIMAEDGIDPDAHLNEPWK